jgi:hypothetical protein
LAKSFATHRINLFIERCNVWTQIPACYGFKGRACCRWKPREVKRASVTIATFLLPHLLLHAFTCVLRRHKRKANTHGALLSGSLSSLCGYQHLMCYFYWNQREISRTMLYKCLTVAQITGCKNCNLVFTNFKISYKLTRWFKTY